MIFRTKSQNLVLFGVEEISNFFSAEFCLYSEGLPEKIIVYNIETSESIELFVPNEIRNKILPGIAQHTTFQKVKPN